jgi:hypothetical protein
MVRHQRSEYPSQCEHSQRLLVRLERERARTYPLSLTAEAISASVTTASVLVYGGLISEVAGEYLAVPIGVGAHTLFIATGGILPTDGGFTVDSMCPARI